jgi:hypothetical protein
MAAALLWASSDTIKNETGIVFGLTGHPFLDVALERARGTEGKRSVLAIAAANPAALRGKPQLAVADIKGSSDLDALLAELNRNNPFDAILFYGLNEFAQIVMTEKIGASATPEQKQWGEMARLVSNYIRRLTTVSSVVWATCDVIIDTDDKTKAETKRLSANPGLLKLILGDLNEKIYVVARKGEDGSIETAVQDNAALALKFTAPERQRVSKPAAETTEAREAGEASSNGNSIRSRLGGGGRRRV